MIGVTTAGVSTAVAAAAPAAMSVTKAILWNTVTETSSQLFTMLGCYEGVAKLAPELHLLLERLDLEAKLNATHALLRGIGAEEEALVSSELGESGFGESSSYCLVNGQSALGVCMANVAASVEKIHHDLTEIHKAIQAHQRKWFNSWRTVEYGPHLTRLETHKLVFDSRLETLMKFLMLPRDVVSNTGCSGEHNVKSVRYGLQQTTSAGAALAGGKAAAYDRHSRYSSEATCSKSSSKNLMASATFVYPPSPDS